MRLHRLEVEGFGPFRARQTVDFDEFAADGIFLISGRTGTGKSSLLDAVCFALYGGVPRYEGGDKRLRSDHCEPDDPTEVTVEFTARGERWRVSRSPEYPRPKRRGDGFTIEPHRASLERESDGGWVGVASRPVDVADELHAILQLSQQQFLQVILLAQNRFARFLLAKNDERQSLLRTLFGTRRFEDYERALEQRRKDADAEWRAASDALTLRLDDAEALIDESGWAAEHEDAPSSGDDATAGRVGDWDVRLEAARRAEQRASYRIETLTLQQDELAVLVAEAESVRDAAKAQRERQRQRDRSRETLARLEEDIPAREQDLLALNLALRAEGVRHVIEHAARATAEADAARGAVRDTRIAWDAVLEEVRAAGMTLPDDRDDWSANELEDLGAAWTRESGAWDEVATIELGLPEKAREAEAATTELSEVESRLLALQEKRATIPAALAEVDETLATARTTAAALDSLRERRELLEAQLASARAVESIEHDVAAAQAEETRRNSALAIAVAHVGELYARRQSGMAGELAAQLTDGAPCPVCGAAEHPAPAVIEGEPIEATRVEDAERTRDAAMDAVRAASAAVATAREALAAAAARSGGRSIAEVENELDSVQRDYTAAVAAATQSQSLEVDRATISAEAERIGAEIELVSADITVLRDRVTRSTALLDAARRSVDSARGPFASVEARLAALAELVRAARALADRLTHATAMETAEARAVEECAKALRGSDFASADDARDALRDDAERGELEQRLRTHEAALSAERARLLELELAVLPEEPIDVDATERAVLAARERWTAAMKGVVSATDRVSRLTETIERVAAGSAHATLLRRRYDAIDRLARTMSGKAPNTLRMSLETFVLAAELEEIVEAANLRLAEMSQERYRLSHSDALAARGAASGLGIEVMDAFTGRSRPAQSLSGGETFLASLALALGLAEVVTRRAGGVRLDTLFIDEGFGSLDSETLDTAMQTLDELRQGGRTVGLISHVDAMKEQIPSQILVRTAAAGHSVIAQGGAESSPLPTQNEGASR